MKDKLITCERCGKQVYRKGHARLCFDCVAIRRREADARSHQKLTAKRRVKKNNAHDGAEQ